MKTDNSKTNKIKTISKNSSQEEKKVSVINTKTPSPQSGTRSPKPNSGVRN